MLRVGIIGIGISRQEEMSPLSDVDLAVEAVQKAIKYAEVDPKEIDYVVESAFSATKISSFLEKSGFKTTKSHLPEEYRWCLRSSICSNKNNER
jgi:acetyl-CoA C-acetyltransferase